MEFFENNPDVDLQEVVTLCKQDALKEVESDGEITRVATDNLKKTVEALGKPILGEEGLTFEYREQAQ